MCKSQQVGAQWSGGKEQGRAGWDADGSVFQETIDPFAIWGIEDTDIRWQTKPTNLWMLIDGTNLLLICAQ